MPTKIMKDMLPVGKKNVALTNIARNRGLRVANVPLEDGSSLKLLAGKEEVDSFVMRNGKIVYSDGQKLEGDVYDKLFTLVKYVNDSLVKFFPNRSKEEITGMQLKIKLEDVIVCDKDLNL